jgi:hypothetical protein
MVELYAMAVWYPTYQWWWYQYLGVHHKQLYHLNAPYPNANRGVEVANNKGPVQSYVYCCS